MVVAWEEEVWAEFGTPLTARLATAGTGPCVAGQDIGFVATLTGVEGKSYIIASDRGYLSDCKVVVRVFGGAELATVRLERAGGWDTWTATWRVPEEMRGRTIVASPAFETGPFEVVVEDLVLQVR